MTNSIVFGYSTTIKERHQLLEKDLPDDPQLHYLKQWRERRSLLSDEDFNLSLTQQGLSKLAFNRGVTPLNESHLKVLFNHVRQQPWYQLHQQLFSSEQIFSYSSETALRFHLSYFSEKFKQLLKDYPMVHIDSSAFTSIVDGVRNDLLLLAEKTLIWDVHDIIERHSIVADTPEEAFQLYIEERLSHSENTQQFFSEYPTLSKLLCIRLQFAVDNIHLFIGSLVQENSQIQTAFNVNIPFEITEIETGKGDSHDNGKSVLHFKLNNLNLIYKYKNLQIGEQFNAFLSYIEDLDSQYHFYKVKRVIGSNFTIEEKITQATCHCKSEVEKYYHNYGSLLTITHWLGASDLHMENLIAHKEFPVLIDVETIIATDRTKQNESPQTKQQIIEKKSMISSGLLPLKRYWKRQLEMSALNGTKQKLPFKVRKLVNKSTSEVKLQLDEEYLKGAKNIPLLNNLEVNYQDYTDNIEKGFVEMNNLLLQNKQDVLETVQRLFSNSTVRHLLRDTQDYANFLSFAHHPSCMVDFIEREKIMENLWEAQFITKKVIPLEIEDMLNNDVPRFESNSSDYWIKNTYGQLNNSYTKTSIELLTNYGQVFTKDTLHQSLFFLKESLGTLAYKLEKIEVQARNQNIDNPFLQKAVDIGDLVVDNLKIDQQHNFVYWAESIPNEGNDITLEYPSTNLYNGTAGVFIFLFSLNYYTPKASYQKILTILEKEVFSDELVKDGHFSAFYGDGASLVAAFYAYRLSLDEKYLTRMKLYIERIEKQVYFEENNLDEWLYGKASLLKILVSIHIEVDDIDALKLISTISEHMQVPECDDLGFAHGYSGLIHALSHANLLLRSESITKKIEELNFSLERHLNSADSLNDSWCSGKLGINKSIFSNKERFIPNNYNSITPLDSCLCHGNFTQYLTDLVEKKKEDQVLTHYRIYLKKMSKSLPIGTFNGLSGLGLHLLFKYDSKNSNILFLN